MPIIIIVRPLPPEKSGIFIHDSYACRKNKPVHAGVKRLQRFLRQMTNNKICRARYLQFVVHNYFTRIDKQILYELLAKHIRDEWLSSVITANTRQKH